LGVDNHQEFGSDPIGHEIGVKNSTEQGAGQPASFSPLIAKITFYPWISMGVLLLLSLMVVVSSYSGKTQPTLSSSGQISFDIKTLIISLGFTWILTLTPVVLASRKVHSFYSLYSITFTRKDIKWASAIFIFYLIFSSLWNSLCLLSGWVNKKYAVGNVGEFVNSKTSHWAWLVIVLGALIAPVVEELFFRGLIYPILRKKFPEWFSVIISSALFAILHIQGEKSQDLTTLPVIFFLGCLFAYMREKTGRLNTTIYGHIAINLFAYLVAFVR
jgi:membrane protease YdiL (CAAX protease family)